MTEAPAAEDLARIDAFISAFNEGDVDRCLLLSSPELTVKTAREWPGGGSYSGERDVRAFLEQFLDPWERIRYEHEAPEAICGRVVERARWVGSGRTSGIESSVDFYSVWSLSDGLIARLDVFALREQARASARSGAA